MVQLFWLHGHMYTAPPSVTLGWLVLAFGAPIKMLMLEQQERKYYQFLYRSEIHLLHTVHFLVISRQ